MMCGPDMEEDVMESTLPEHQGEGFSVRKCTQAEDFPKLFFFLLKLWWGGKEEKKISLSIAAHVWVIFLNA